MTDLTDTYAFETRCHDCNVLCLHFEPRLVICPECETILRFESGLEADEIIDLAQKLHGTGKSARWGLRELAYNTEEYEFTNILDDLKTCGLVKCTCCSFWQWSTDLTAGQCKVCLRGDFYD